MKCLFQDLWRTARHVWSPLNFVILVNDWSIVPIDVTWPYNLLSCRFFSSPNRTKIEKKKTKTKTGDSNIRILRLNGNTFSSKNLNQKSRKNDEYKVASTLPETAYVNFRHLFFARIAPWVSLFLFHQNGGRRGLWNHPCALCSNVQFLRSQNRWR